MDADELFEAWKEQRRRAEPPEGFADRVLASLPEDNPGTSRVAALPPSLTLSWPAQAAVCALAGLACLLRIGSFIALFIPS
jgi:hypothetical protein